MIGSDRYTVQVFQYAFRAAKFTYPVTSTDMALPILQMNKGSSLVDNWMADGSGNGNGTVEVLGEGGTPLSVSLDLDLTPNISPTKAHVSGTIACPPS